MPLGAVGLAVAAAFAHAFWNLLVAGSRDPAAASAVAISFALVAFAPAAVLTGGVSSEAVPWIAASAALHLIYTALLAASYRRSELSLVYPLSRGAAPVLVLGAGAVLAATPTPAQVAGVLIVAAGIVMVHGFEVPHDLRDLGFVAGVAAFIASYTLVDKEGIAHAEPIAYLWLVLAGVAVVYVPGVAASAGPETLRAELRPRLALAGLCMFGAYALVLAALSFAPAAPVAAVRETSIVVATGLAALSLKERVAPTRLAGAVVVFAGVAVLALG